jgi:hypothetical protein
MHERLSHINEPSLERKLQERESEVLIAQLTQQTAVNSQDALRQCMHNLLSEPLCHRLGRQPPSHLQFNLELSKMHSSDERS